MAALTLALIFQPGGSLAYHQYRSLNSCQDEALQKALDRCLVKLKLDDDVRMGRLSVALVDITDPGNPHLAMVNGNKMMYAASLPKIAILLGAFEQIKRGQLSMDDVTMDSLVQMIRRSSNRAATDMLNRVGKDFLIELLQSDPYRFYDLQGDGGLWVGKEYGKSPAFKRDPLYNLSHGATAFQVARFYYLLETGRLVSPEMSRAMKDILSHSDIHHKFVSGLEKNRPGSRIYRKSGTWRTYHADSALIERDGRKYIAVALAQSPNGEFWLRRLIVELDNLVFQNSANN